ncbi:MAG: LemA family protein [Bacteroidales bacterium]|nr:LemA family protein [Bacteroidales bacterium]MDD2323474.1 LemA family protein [Bacteroidales bacterium]MDY0285046.1 LemA family protein [Bacteroidales bacterium]
MKNKNVIIFIVAIVAILVIWSVGAYNGLVSAEEGVDAQWAQVENVYQRRADLIPNLVNTVKGYADFEQQTLTDVIEARAKATSVQIDPANITAANVEQFQAAQEQLSGALSRLLVTIERYPELKANRNFLELQAQLEGTENRITVERNKFNETAKLYNTSIRKFPKNLFASLFGFDRKGYFTAKEGAENAPVVEF